MRLRKIEKKGELSMNVIIIAAIGLLVLVILSVIFLQRMGIFGRGSADCEARGGTCNFNANACGENQAKIFGGICYADGKPAQGAVCCKDLGLA